MPLLAAELVRVLPRKRLIRLARCIKLAWACKWSLSWAVALEEAVQGRAGKVWNSFLQSAEAGVVPIAASAVVAPFGHRFGVDPVAGG